MTEPSPIHPIEQRILDRSYSSPSTARAGVARSQLGAREKKRLIALADSWEQEGSAEIVIGGVSATASPSAHESNGASQMAGNGAGNGAGNAKGKGKAAFERKPPVAPVSTIVAAARRKGLAAGSAVLPLTVSLNARIRARLTVYGVARLYAARDRVAVPEDLVAHGCEWETTLFEFMSVLGPTPLSTDLEAVPTVANCIELVSL